MIPIQYVDCSLQFKKRYGTSMNKEKNLVKGTSVTTPTKNPYSSYFQTDKNMNLTPELYKIYNNNILSNNEKNMCIPVKNNTMGKYLKTSVKPCHFNLEPCICFSKTQNLKLLNKLRYIDMEKSVNMKRNKLSKKIIFTLWKFNN